MPLNRPCLDCGTPTHDTRCPPCHQRWLLTHRQYGPEWRAFSKAQIEAHPWCTDCGKTTDLTTDHGVFGEVVCRGCNTRRRQRIGGR